jgi:hypothetical protein
LRSAFVPEAGLAGIRLRYAPCRRSGRRSPRERSASSSRSSAPLKTRSAPGAKRSRGRSPSSRRSRERARPPARAHYRLQPPAQRLGKRLEADPPGAIVRSVFDHDLRVRLVFYPAERARRIEAASDRLNRIFIVALAAERVGEPLDAPDPRLAVRRELRSNFETPVAGDRTLAQPTPRAKRREATRTALDPRRLPLRDSLRRWDGDGRPRRSRGGSGSDGWGRGPRRRSRSPRRSRHDGSSR